MLSLRFDSPNWLLAELKLRAFWSWFLKLFEIRFGEGEQAQSMV
jgi:hypothetical protein